MMAMKRSMKEVGIDYMGKRHVATIIVTMITVVLALTACGRNSNTPPIDEVTSMEVTENGFRPIADGDTDAEVSADAISLEQLTQVSQ